MRLSLKLGLPAAAVAALLVGYALWSWAPRSIAQAEAEYQRAIDRQLNAIAIAIVPILRERKLTQVYETLHSLQERNPEWLELELRDSGGGRLYPPSSLSRTQASRARDVRIITRPIGADGEALGLLGAHVDLAPVRAAIERDRYEVLAAFILGLLVLLTLSGIAINAFVRRPLLRVADAAHRFAQGDLQAPLPSTNGGESGELAAGVALMRDALSRYESELRQEAAQRQRAEEALRESEERYSLAVRGANDGLWEWNLKTNEVYFSPRWKSMLGYGEQEIGDHYDEWHKRVHPDDIARVLADLQAHLEGRNPRYEVEHRLLHRDGSYRWVLARGTAIRHASGKPYRMVGLHTDITERKRVEEMLWRIAEATAPLTGDEFFRSLVRHFADLLGVKYAFITECLDFPTTRVRTLAFWAADRFADNLEYPLAGTPCHDVIADGKVCLHPRGIPALFPDDKGLIDLGVESFLGIPIVNSAARVIGHLAFLDDKPMGDEMMVESIFKIITARAAAELERKRVEEMLWRIAEATAPLTGAEFFRTLVRHFAEILGVRYAFITECVDFPTTRVRQLAFWANDAFADNNEFALAGTPCEDVVADGKMCLYARNVQAAFPGNQVLPAMSAESYLGIPIFGSSGQVIGHLAFIDVKPFREELLVQSIFKIFTARAGAELERRHAEAEAEKAHIELAIAQKEKQLARRIQQALLPQDPKELKGALVTGCCVPAADLGGDYYDFFLGADGSIDMVIADVSGHGLGAAVIMSETRGALRAEAHLELSPAAALRHLNDLLYQDLDRAECFISLFYARYQPAEHRLSYASAGHNPPLLLRSGAKTLDRLNAAGLVLGVSQDIDFEERHVELGQGDLLVLYTDGLVEVQNGDHELFGLERLCGALAAMRAAPPDAIMDGLLAEGRAFCRCESFADDVALAVLKVA